MRRGCHPCGRSRRGACSRSRRACARADHDGEEGGRSCRGTRARARWAGTVFPNAIDAKYAKDSAGKGRMHTCVDQYHANQATNGNGGLKWIQKGGGYYSECNKHLKGPA